MVSNRGTLLAQRMQCFLFFSFTFQPMFRDNNEKRDWTVLGNTTSHVWSLARLPATKPTIYYPGHKKRTMLLMHKIRILWYRGIRVLHSAAESWANPTCNCRDFMHRCIVAKSDCRFFDITWCISKMVLFFCPGQYMYKTYLCNLQSLNIWAIFNPGAIQKTVVVHWANKKNSWQLVDIFTLYLCNAFTKPKLLFHAKIQS